MLEFEFGLGETRAAQVRVDGRGRRKLRGVAGGEERPRLAILGKRLGTNKVETRHGKLVDKAGIKLIIGIPRAAGELDGRCEAKQHVDLSGGVFDRLDGLDELLLLKRLEATIDDGLM